MPVPAQTAPMARARRARVGAVGDRIAEAIVTGVLEPGAPLHDAAIATWLQAPVETVREAMPRLSALGLVDVQGPVPSVTTVDDELLWQTIEFTGMQASLAASLAATRMHGAEIGMACALLDAMIVASDDEQAGQLHALSGELVQFVARRCGNELVRDAVRSSLQLARAALRTSRPLLGTRASRAACYREVQRGFRERDAELVGASFRRQYAR